jgi:hypothetical protein
MQVIDTPEGINMFRMLAIKHGLKLELLGMRHSKGLVFAAAKQMTGKKTRKDCLTAIEAMIEEAKQARQ